MKYKASEKSLKLTELAVKYRDGDQSVKDEFFSELYKYLYVICKGNVLNQNLNDTISDVLLQVLQILPNYDETRSQFTTYIQFRIIDSIIATNKSTEQPGLYLSKLAKSILKNNKFIEYQYSNDSKDYNSIKNKIKELYPNLSEVQIKHILPSIYNYIYNQNRIKTPEDGQLTLEAIPEQKTTEDIVIDNENKRMAYKCLNLMEPEIRSAVIKIFGIDCDKQTITKVAADMNFTRPALTQKINAAFAKIRDIIELEQISNIIKKGLVFSGIIIFISLFI